MRRSSSPSIGCLRGPVCRCPGGLRHRGTDVCAVPEGLREGEYAFEMVYPAGPDPPMSEEFVWQVRLSDGDDDGDADGANGSGNLCRRF